MTGVRSTVASGVVHTLIVSSSVAALSSVQTPYGTARYRTADCRAVPRVAARYRTVSCGKRICKFMLIRVLMYASIWWKWRLMTAIVVAAAAYYYLEDEHNMKKQVRRPRRF
jgi:hypothetical protein